jgi:uncharacterized protein RhaS with RHS repeats
LIAEKVSVEFCMIRLAQALGPSFTLAYTYDNWSNRTSQKITSGSGTAPQWTLSPTLNNRVTGWLYDAAGNVLKDDSHTYTYDAENRVHSVDGATTYAYDGENDRIAVLNNGSVQTRSLYDFQGRIMTELGPNFKATRANIYVGKELFAEDAPDPYRTSTSTATLLRITDQVGTLRSRWDIGANWVGALSLGATVQFIASP